MQAVGKQPLETPSVQRDAPIVFIERAELSPCDDLSGDSDWEGVMPKDLLVAKH